jgi:RND family efflux transporter MFP subunit
MISIKSGLLLAVLSVAPVAAADIEVTSETVPEMKAVFGRVEARDVVPARARIGGTLTELSVSAGSRVTAGEVIGRVVDDKLALQVRAFEARLNALTAERDNARTEYERAQALLGRGVVTQQRVDQLRTQVDVLIGQIAAAEAEKTVVLQQAAEGEVRAPLSGRVLAVPVTRGSVAMPGEPVAVVAGGGTFLRLALPERHARSLREGATVALATETGAPTRSGRLARIYPQIEQGRVTADVEVDGLDDAFVGERVLVRVPVGTRNVLAVPAAAIARVSGTDQLRLRTAQGERVVAIVVGATLDTAAGPRVEILSGLTPGDRVIVP